MLAMHPECQQKVFEEILVVMPNPDVDLTPIHLNRMVYLDQCIREAQRLFPTVPLIGRRAHETTNISGFDIPPNIPIFIGIRQIHRRKDYYDNALEYKPDRFKPSAHHPNKDMPGSYIPFSLGQRNCIGTRRLITFFFQDLDNPIVLNIFFFLFEIGCLCTSLIASWEIIQYRLQLCNLHDEISRRPYNTELSSNDSLETARAQSETKRKYNINNYYCSLKLYRITLIRCVHATIAHTHTHTVCSGCVYDGCIVGWVVFT